MMQPEVGEACARERFDPGEVARAGRRASTLAIPLVRELTARVAGRDPRAAGFVHFGATSQDVIDTALVLQAREAGTILAGLLDRLGEALATLTRDHRHTPMLGRTLMQPAVPIPFGWKAAGWLGQVHRGREALARALRDASVLQFGGAAGTLAALGADGDEVAQRLAAALELSRPDASWHSARDRLARLGAELAIVTGSLAKIGRDVALMMQPEVGEAFEPAGAGRGGSSAMPHKRNPVGAMLAIEAAGRAPGLAASLFGTLVGEHERGLGGWQNSLFLVADLFDAAGSAAEAVLEVIAGLRVEPAAMLRNLEAQRGFVFAEAVTVALADALGKPLAHATMERVCRDALERGEALRDALARARDADPVLAAALDAGRLDALFDPRVQRGDADAMIDRTLAAWRAA
jgi:3-carboxy-cis,cis-muconate cycloisomerase